MKRSNKKALEKRGIVTAGRAQSAPSAQTHRDKRRANRSAVKASLKRETIETARNRGPFPFGLRGYKAPISTARDRNF